ncbi:MAG: DUF5606 domain-containing protein [Porphyromonas sp.]|nr:DUF5606 domain-containing protein [Porphyromonas sp.]
MLKEILSVSGKPGLFRLVSRTKNSLIVEALDPKNKRRMPVYASDRVVSLGDISIFTNEEDIPLYEVLESLSALKGTAEVDLASLKDDAAYSALMAEILPSYDRERVYITDIKKLVKWYNLLVVSGITAFRPQEEPQAEGDDK